jgi:hypothetical protein
MMVSPLPAQEPPTLGTNLTNGVVLYYSRKIIGETLFRNFVEDIGADLETRGLTVSKYLMSGDEDLDLKVKGCFGVILHLDGIETSEMKRKYAELARLYGENVAMLIFTTEPTPQSEQLAPNIRKLNIYYNRGDNIIQTHDDLSITCFHL